jgi:hypothetical protein
MADDAKRGANPVSLAYEMVFPEYPAVPPPVSTLRPWQPQGEIVEPAYLCFDRLLFEQINSERYGWDLGIFHPLISAGIFYFDVAALPYHLGTEPFRQYECNAGYYLPGDRVPLLLYRPEWSLSGTLAEAATIGALLVIFP